MEPSEHRKLNSLLAASRTGDTASVANVWRELTPDEQESVLFRLLAMHTETGSETAEPHRRPDLPIDALEDTAAMAAVEQTALIPKQVEDLRGLTGSQGDEQPDFSEPHAPPNEFSDYRSRWFRRWKFSALVAAWAVTTVFAFTADTSTYGPNEWVVALFCTVVIGGASVGTLLNFAVAAISTRTQGPTGND